MAEYIVPCLFTLVFVVALWKKIPLYENLTDGAMSGLQMMVKIFCSLLVLLPAVAMLRASGGMEILSRWLSPIFSRFGIPPETAPLMLVRPLSGSAALAVGMDLMKTYGVDSRIGLTAAVMLGSTETTFYTISVYFGAAKVRGTRYAVPAALLADFTGFVMAALCVRFFF